MSKKNGLKADSGYFSEPAACSRSSIFLPFRTVCGDECETGDPCGNRMTGKKEISARLHVAFQRKGDTQHKGEVDHHDNPTDEGWFHDLCTCSRWLIIWCDSYG